ncbi:MAG TPA: hypothetical protein VEK07_07170 [Polyangiaceae bacterium]|nr:hypothetical protein [Polyangiaceae bacterium]
MFCHVSLELESTEPIEILEHKEYGERNDDWLVGCDASVDPFLR